MFVPDVRVETYQVPIGVGNRRFVAGERAKKHSPAAHEGLMVTEEKPLGALERESPEGAGSCPRPISKSAALGGSNVLVTAFAFLVPLIVSLTRDTSRCA